MFLGYLDTTALRAFLIVYFVRSYNSSTLVYINYLTAELLSHRFYQPERHPDSASLKQNRQAPQIICRIHCEIADY